MTQRLKFTGRLQVLDNNQSTLNEVLDYSISNVVDYNNGTRYILTTGQEVEAVLPAQCNCILVTADNPVAVVTDSNDTSFVTNFTVDTGSDVVFAATPIYAYTTQPLTVSTSTSGTLPAPLAISTTYYAISLDDDEIQLATSAVNAKAGTAIDITDTGDGTHTLSIDTTYNQSIDEQAHSTTFLLTATNVKRVTIKNPNASTTNVKFFAYQDVG